MKQYNHLIGTLFCQFNGITLIFGQGQRLTTLIVQTLSYTARQVVFGLCTGTTNDHNGSIAILNKAVFIASIDCCNLVQRRLSGVVHFLSVLVVCVVVGLVQLLIDIQHSGVHIEASTLKLKFFTSPSIHSLIDNSSDITAGCIGDLSSCNGVCKISLILAQCLFQADIRTLCLYTKARTQQIDIGANAQQSDIRTTVQRQHIIVIFQQDSTLCHLTAVQVHRCLNQCSGVTTAIFVEQFSRWCELIIQGVFFIVIRYKYLTRCTQIGINGTCICLQDPTQDQGEGQGKTSCTCQTTPKCFSKFLIHGFLDPPLLLTYI